MSADLLREAAALMREQAEAATPGPWRGEVRSSLMTVATHDGGLVVSTVGMPENPGAIEDAAHIASWHPAVALAVADWLVSIAEAWEVSADKFRPGGTHGFMGTWSVPEHHPALAVAAAYLGRDA